MSATNLEGKKFGRLTVKKQNGRDKYGAILWECECDCGNIKTVRGIDLRNGGTKSCGCLNRDIHTTHGMVNALEYRCWAGMLTRCNNSKVKEYKNYGGRGICVCKEWYKFENFFKDMGKRPGGYTIERKDNDGDYTPDNCSWETMVTQARNKRLSTRNHTGVIGVHYCKTNKYYCSSIKADGKRYSAGGFKTLCEAAISRKQLEKKYWLK